MEQISIRSKATLLIEKHNAGGDLTLDEISILMQYAIEILAFIRKETEACIARLEEQFGNKLKHDKSSTV